MAGQDGCESKHALPPNTPIANTTTGLHNKYHPELPENRAVGSLTTQNLKKPHSSNGWVGGAETQRGGKVRRGMEMQSGSERHRDGNGWSHMNMWWIKNVRDTLGAKDTMPGKTIQPSVPAPGR